MTNHSKLSGFLGLYSFFSLLVVNGGLYPSSSGAGTPRQQEPQQPQLGNYHAPNPDRNLRGHEDGSSLISSKPRLFERAQRMECTLERSGGTGLQSSVPIASRPASIRRWSRHTCTWTHVVWRPDFGPLRVCIECLVMTWHSMQEILLFCCEKGVKLDHINTAVDK